MFSILFLAELSQKQTSKMVVNNVGCADKTDLEIAEVNGCFRNTAPAEKSTVGEKETYAAERTKVRIGLFAS